MFRLSSSNVQNSLYVRQDNKVETGVVCYVVGAYVC